MSGDILFFPSKKPEVDTPDAGSVYGAARRLGLVDVVVCGMDEHGDFFVVHNGNGDELLEMACEEA